MTINQSPIILVLIIFLSSCTNISTRPSKPQPDITLKGLHVNVATGGKSGVYYAFGVFICKFMKYQYKKSCTANESGGSYANIPALVNNEIEIALAHSNIAFDAYTNGYRFENLNYSENLRTVFSAYPDPLSILVKVDSGIDTVADLKGKAVNFISYGSTNVSNSRSIKLLKIALKDKAMSLSRLAEVKPIAPDIAQRTFCKSDLEVLITSAAIPNDVISTLQNKCKLKFIPVEVNDMNPIVAKHPYISVTSINPGAYKKIEAEQVNTIGYGLNILTRNDVDEATIYRLTKTVFENLDKLKTKHPAFEQLSADKMVKDFISIPLHAGAEQYYKEADLL